MSQGNRVYTNDGVHFYMLKVMISSFNSNLPYTQVHLNWQNHDVRCDILVADVQSSRATFTQSRSWHIEIQMVIATKCTASSHTLAHSLRFFTFHGRKKLPRLND
jgi:hypothetical protein